MKGQGSRRRGPSKPEDLSVGPVLHTHLTLIEVAEPETLAEIRADRRLGPLIVAQLSERLAIAAPSCAKDLVQRSSRPATRPSSSNRPKSGSE